MKDVRRIIVIFVIAVLFAILVQVTIEAVYPSPKYEDYCENKFEPRPDFQVAGTCPEVKVPEGVRESCPIEKGRIEYKTDDSGCPTEAYCETCDKELEEANKNYNLIVFIISSITGIIALLVGLYLPQKNNPVHEWVGSGFLLGGLFTIFVGTVRYFGDMGRYLRPVVILIELILVIYLAYKKLGKK